VKAFTEEKLRVIYDDFVTEADSAGSLCDCASLTWEGQRVPLYERRLVQDLYLLRYLPAYLAEYCRIYRELLDSEFLEGPPRIASIGCGCGIDAWGAHFALAQNGRGDARGLSYAGFDRIDWAHSEGPAGFSGRINTGDILRLKVLGGPYNTIVFAKSISEFPADGLTELCLILAATTFSERRVALVASMMSEGGADDEAKLRRVAEVMCVQHGYEIAIELRLSPGETPGAYLGDVCREFTYPKEIKDRVMALHSLCKRRVAQGARCTECAVVARHPITTRRYLRSLTLLLEKRPRGGRTCSGDEVPF
jgi:hypothetical protein